MFTCNRHQHHDLNLNIDDIGMFRLVTLRYCQWDLPISRFQIERLVCMYVCGGGGGGDIY